MSQTIPESLLQQGLKPLWAAIRERLDRYGPQRRGTVSVPDLDPASALTLRSIVGSTPRKLDLEKLETAFADRGIGADLNEALTRLGHPPSAKAARRRTDRARAARAREALRGSVQEWPEPWAREWAQDLERCGLLSGLDDVVVDGMVTDVRRLLDSLLSLKPHREGSETSKEVPCVARSEDRDTPVDVSRVELAAQLFGSSHALDTGTTLASFVTRALKHLTGESLDGRELWEAAGIPTDSVSAPALVWALPVVGDSPLSRILRDATNGGVPIHLSLFAIRRHPIRVPAGTPILVVENPRLVEAAAERSMKCCVLAANGNPAMSVTTLIQQLQLSGARVWYHGDFDAPGIAICRRMHDLGCSPWMMDSSDYHAAVSEASSRGIPLGKGPSGAGATPWDPELEVTFDASRLIVHEEFVLDVVLARFARLAGTATRAAGTAIRACQSEA